MPEKLPKGWVKTNLGEVCLPVANIQPEDSPDTEFTYFDIGGIDNERNRISETKLVTGRSAPSRARQALRKDDILFSTVRTYLRKIARVESDYPNPVASTGFAVIRPAEDVSSQFLFFQVLSENFLQPLHALQIGSSYPAVRARNVFDQPILLPPTREQERIAAKLSAAFSAVERAETAARRAQKRLDRYRAAVLDAAVSGELSRTWRESQKKEILVHDTGEILLQRFLVARRSRWEQAELRRFDAAAQTPKGDKWKLRYRELIPPQTDGLPEQPKRWAWISIDQLSWSSGYGTSVKCTYEGKGPAVLRIPNIRNRTIHFDDLKFATTSKEFDDDDFVAPGDLLLIRTNGSKDLIGRVAVVKDEPPRQCGFASYLIRFRLVGDKTVWSWIALAWDSSMLRSGIESRAATTAGQYNVSLSGLADLAVPLPPMDEQAEIVGEVERRMAAADRLQAALEQQLTRASATRQSLMHEAFSGRLVPQDPDDEPASVVLKNIRAAREKEAQNPRGKRMPKSKPKSKVVLRPLLDILREHREPMTPEQLFRDSGYQQEFEDNECRQEIVDRFYEELRQQVGPKGPVLEKRPDRNTVLLQVKP
jgi:type I restriction enzyme, S subunit